MFNVKQMLQSHALKIRKYLPTTGGGAFGTLAKKWVAAITPIRPANTSALRSNPSPVFVATKSPHRIDGTRLLNTDDILWRVLP